MTKNYLTFIVPCKQNAQTATSPTDLDGSFTLWSSAFNPTMNSDIRTAPLAASKETDLWPTKKNRKKNK